MTTEEPFEPSALRAPLGGGDKGDLYVPGAGTMGMYILLVSLSMLFGASIAGYLVIRLMRSASGPWHEAGMVRLPHSLWISTLIIIASSFTIQAALKAVRRDDEPALMRALVLTLILGGVFLVLQAFNWVEVYLQVRRLIATGNLYVFFFYTLTALHAAHVVGGLIPLAITTVKARRGRYSRYFHPGVRYCAIYWHFLDIVWVILFVLVYLV